MRKWLLVLLMVPGMVRAEFYSGNDLYSRLIDTGSIVNQMVGLGYVVGVYDVGVHAVFCPRREDSISAGQISDMVKNWLIINAHRRHESAEKLVLEVFKQTWPCANRRSRGSV